MFIVNNHEISQEINEKEYFEYNQELGNNYVTQNTDQEGVEDAVNISPKEDIFYDDNNLWIPSGWSGLPLSIDNPLYFNQSIPEVEMYRAQMVNRLKDIPLKNWAVTENDAEWKELVYNYENLIGWNGIFDAVDQAQKELEIDVSRRLHVLGELLAASKMVTKGRYVVEITSRDILHKAPMHGGVWSITKNLLDSYAIHNDFVSLFETIDENLCFFKNEENMGNIWISCVHGVGHGIGKYYGSENIGVGLEICAKHPDHQYQYACATGIYMELSKEFELKTFSPCDTNRFAPACFRFKNRLTSQIFYDTPNACSTQATPYHRRACIWGFAYIKENSAPRTAYSVCEPFRPHNATDQPQANDYAACFDGFFGSHELTRIPLEVRTTFCDPLLPFATAYKICKYYSELTLRKFTFEDEEVYFYNYDLLEELFDESLLGKSASWLPEWNFIIPKKP